MSEKVTKVYNGFLMLAVGILLMASVTLFILNAEQEYVWMTVLAVILMIITGILVLPGLFIVNPNEAKVMVLFGKYAGSVRDNGFFWPILYSKKKISLRARNLAARS